MGQLTNDMSRLVEEIRAGRAGRGRMLRDLNRATVEMKLAVAGMQAGFHSARADIAQRQQHMLQGFVSGLRATVTGLRKELADDLAGARKAWLGAAAGTMGMMPGRTRRGAKRFYEG